MALADLMKASASKGADTDVDDDEGSEDEEREALGLFRTAMKSDDTDEALKAFKNLLAACGY